MESKELESLIRDFPERKYPGMIELRINLERFRNKIRKDFMDGMRYLFEIQGFIWGIYTAGMIDRRRRDIIVEEIIREAQEGIEKYEET